MKWASVILASALCLADEYPLPSDGTARGTGLVMPPENVRLAAIKAAVKLPKVRLAATLPAAVDNSKSKFFPPIGDQGSLGSCAQFAGIYYCFSYEYSRLYGQPVLMSPKWTWNALNDGTGQGSWWTSGWEIVRDHGCATLNEFPYDSNYSEWPNGSALWIGAMYRRVSGWVRITDVNTDQGINDLKREIAFGKIFAFGTFIFSVKTKRVSDNPADANDDPYVGELAVCALNGGEGGHAMTIVGYNDNIWVDANDDKIVQSDELGAFKVANSWGKNWGNRGFIWFTYNSFRLPNPAARNWGAATLNEAWGVNAQLSQPKMVWKFKLSGMARNHLVVSRSGSLGNSGTSYFSINGGSTPFAGIGKTNAIEVALDHTSFVGDTMDYQRLTLADWCIGYPITIEDVRYSHLDINVDVPLAKQRVIDYNSTTFEYKCSRTARQKIFRTAYEQ